MPQLLVVDDDKLILDCFRYAFPSDQISMTTTTNAIDAVEAFRQQSFDVVVADIQLQDSSGLELLREFQAIDKRVPVILMTGHGSANTAIEAMRHGAFEYLLKPLDLDLLQTVIHRALEMSQMSRSPARIAGDIDTDVVNGDFLVGQCPAMQEVFRQIGRVAGQDITVLIAGESGTGKEVVARAIYQYSKRDKKTFLAINCAAIPENLLESELFGHEKGSFTGADNQRIGKFEQSDGGTLFLDEIGDMTPLTQTKILRVLQNQQFERVGGNETVHTNVRLIAATSRDLTEMMTQGHFRSDLFYRLNTYTIHLPPLRERHGDLPLLVNYFLNRFSHELDKTVSEVSLEAMDLLMQYQWPGNIRELQSVLKHAVIESVGSAILPESLPATIRNQTSFSRPNQVTNSESSAHSNQVLINFIHQRIRAGSENLYDEVIQRAERMLLNLLLPQVDANISRASTILGLSRSTLRVKLASLGIQVKRTVRLKEESSSARNMAKTKKPSSQVEPFPDERPSISKDIKLE